MSGELTRALKLPSIRGLSARRVRRPRLLRIMVLALAGCTVLLLLGLLVILPTGVTRDPREQGPLVLGTVAALGGSIAIWLLNKRVSVDLASPLLLVLIVAVALFTNGPGQAIDGRWLLVFSVPIVAGIVLLRPRVSLLVACVSGLAILVARWLTGVPLLNIPAMLGFFVLAVLAWPSSRTLEGALDNLGEAHNALRESEERYRTLVETSPDAIVLVGVDGKVIFCNQQFASMHGIDSVEEAIGRPSAELVAPEDRELSGSQMEKALDGEHIAATIITMLRPDGSRFPAEVSSSALFDAQGRPEAVMMITRDVARRQHVEEQLQRHLEKMALLGQVTAVTSAATDWTEALRELCKELGTFLKVPQAGFALLNPERSIATVVVDYSDAETSSAEGSHIKVAGNPSMKFILEQKLPLAISDAQTDPLLAGVHELMHSRNIRSILLVPVVVEGQVIGTLGFDSLEPREFSQDEVDLVQHAASQAGQLLMRRRAEEALKEYSDRLEEMVAMRSQELHTAQERLLRHEKMALLGQLAGGLGHELRNPLGAMRNAVYLLNLILKDPEPKVKEALEILDVEVCASDKIIGSLVEFTRTQAPTWRPVEVNSVVAHALSRAAVPQEVELVTDLSESLPTILADPQQLSQAFHNIILNGAQAMPDGGRLVVRTEAATDGYISASFSDSGGGITAENLERIFEPLFTTKARGIGLGLALVKTLVEGHGGTVEVRSEVHKGSTFTVRLPVNGRRGGRPAD